MKEKEVIYTVIAHFIGFLILFMKKKRQVGRTWEGPVQAIVWLKDKKLSCMHCSHDRFNKREGLLNTTWLTFFRLQFFNQSTVCYSCRNCGCVHSFISPEEKTEITRSFQK